MKNKYLRIDLYTSDNVTDQDLLKVTEGESGKIIGSVLSKYGFIDDILPEQKFRQITNNQSHWKHAGFITCSPAALKQLLNKL